MKKTVINFPLKTTTRHTLVALLAMAITSTAVSANATSAGSLTSDTNAINARTAAANDAKSEPLIPSGSADVIVERIEVGGPGSSPTNERSEVMLAQAGGNERVIIKQVGTFGGPNGDFETILSEALSGISGSGLSITSGKFIKNAPYSAEVISEKIQNLPDGNQIVKRTTSLAFRDSAGRTRQEARNEKSEVRSIHINDAVEHVRYVLSPAQKTASKIGFDRDLSKKIEELRTQSLASGKSVTTSADGKTITVQALKPGVSVAPGPSGSPSETIIRQIDGGKEMNATVVIKKFGNEAGASATNSSHVTINGNAITSHLGEAMRGPGFAFNFEDSNYSAKATTRELGAKSFDGVAATGKLISYTIPAGEVGNKNPITVSTETWYAPDLQVTVYSKKSDPRSGETIYRLANVKRTEQPLALFAVPSDYTVKDAESIAVKTRENK